MVTYCAELNNISWSTKIIKIIRVLDLFHRTINYWNSVNRTVVDDYFETMKTRDYMCVENFNNFRLLFRLICTDCEHVEDFHLLLGDLFNNEGDLIL